MRLKGIPWLSKLNGVERANPLRVLVCGGRNFPNQGLVFMALDNFHRLKTPITELMQGGCPTGVDKFASEWAYTRKIKRWICTAEWDKYGKAAGPKRNARMLEWKPDVVIAFAGGKGTANMIEQAEAAGVPVVRI